MTDPATLMARIEEDCDALDNGAKFLDEMTEQLANAELAYLDALDTARLEVEDYYTNRDMKLPSEAQRDARAHSKMQAGLRRDFVTLKRKVELVKEWGRMREKALSGRQSELSFLKAEGSAPTNGEPAWSGGDDSAWRRVA